MSIPNRFCNECGAQVQTVDVEIRNSETKWAALTVMQGVCIVCGKTMTFGA